MSAVNTVLLWVTCCAAAASAEMVMTDVQGFLLQTMRQDLSWARYLDVAINVDEALLTTAAKNVVHGLTSVTPPATPSATPSATPPDTPTAVTPATPPDTPTATTPTTPLATPPDTPTATTPATPPATPPASPRATRPGVVTVNALHVVADVVSCHLHESDALEFGLAAIVSAVKCNVLEHVAVQAHCVDRALSAGPAPVNDARVTTVWNELAVYLDRLARLREPVADESELYRLWTAVTIKARDATLVAADLAPFRATVDGSRRAACGDAPPPELVPDKRKYDPAAEHWDNADGLAAIFDRSQRELDDTFRRLPVTTWNRELWNEYLSRTELLREMAEVASRPPPPLPLPVDMPIHTTDEKAGAVTHAVPTDESGATDDGQPPADS